MKPLVDDIRSALDFDRNIHTVKGMNTAFLQALNGDDEALRFLQVRAGENKWAAIAGFYLRGYDEIHRELPAPTIAKLRGLVKDLGQDGGQVQEEIWKILYPEACGILGHEQQRIAELRRRREVRIEQANDRPIGNAALEILFTSNILLTLPADDTDIDSLDLSDTIKARLHQVRQEKQFYWYDHPIQIGVSPDKNEAIYGLIGLDEAVEFEKQRGTIAMDDRVTLVLSVSVTHQGLKGIAKEYLEAELEKSAGIRHLDITIFTDSDTRDIVDQVIAAALPEADDAALARLRHVFGVDGEYGRHYSFLKAIAALWHTLVDKEIRATFKIDTDQVFPQEVLVAETGQSAFELVTTPLWGARGVDSDGEPVELGMIAGALVNQRDIDQGLFTPDVRFPKGPQKPSQSVFFSPLPQALSTEAEMMTRYQAGERLDGGHTAIQRVHVTGGTNGILVDSLMKYRPFTPSFVGRAEDQAYILSTLYQGAQGTQRGRAGAQLRYVHQPGLIMRHDKEAFAQEAIEAAYLGKVVGDYVRTLVFSYYARALPWGAEKTKQTTDPFTGGFISEYPITVVSLRMALDALAEFDKSPADGEAFVTMAAERLTTILATINDPDANLERQFRDEKAAWDSYYDALAAIAQQDGLRSRCRAKLGKILEQCHVHNASVVSD
jgi:hypothetical protein